VITGAKYQKGDKEIIVTLLQGDDDVRGRRVSKLITDWWNWTLSPRIYDDQKDDVYFLRMNPNDKESNTAKKAKFESSAKVRKNQAILFPVLSTMIDKGTYENEDPHEKRIRTAKAENDDPGTKISCTIDNHDILGENDKDKIRLSSDEFKIDATGGCLLLIDFPVPSKDKYPAATDGYFVCIKELPPHEDPYEIRIKAKGANNYEQDIGYKVYVT
jgi:hypothetical protein